MDELFRALALVLDGGNVDLEAKRGTTVMLCIMPLSLVTLFHDESGGHGQVSSPPATHIFHRGAVRSFGARRRR